MSSDDEILNIGPRRMIELGEFDCKVILSALGFITGDTVDSLIRRTKEACPQIAPDEVETNCLAAYLTAKDLHATLTELLATDFEGNLNDD